MPFWTRIEAERKFRFLRSGEMGRTWKGQPDSPTGLSFSTAYRESPKVSATLGKPLTREFLFYPVRLCLFQEWVVLLLVSQRGVIEYDYLH